MSILATGVAGMTGSRLSRFNKFLFPSVLGCAVIVYFLLTFNLFSGPGFLITEMDEGPFYNGARLFADKGSLKTTMLLEENVSRVLEGDWYGPGYPIVFGSFMKILGTNERAFIIMNLLFLFLIGWIILKKFDLPKQTNISLLAAILLTPPVMNYTFYFMPVIFDLLMATLLLWFLQAIHRQAETKGNVGRMILLFVVSALIASFFKQNFIFFSFAILAFSKNKKQFLLYCALIIGAFLATMAYGALFFAPAFSPGLKTISYLMNLDFKAFFSGLYATIHYNIMVCIDDMAPGSDIPVAYLPVFIFNLVMPVIAAIYAFRSKDIKVVALTLITVFSFMFYFCFYTLIWFYFVRLTVPLVLVNLYSLLLICMKNPARVQTIILFVFLILLPFSWSFIAGKRVDKKLSYQTSQTIQSRFGVLRSLVTGNAVNTILLDEDFVKEYHFGTLLISVPLVNDQNANIRYTVNWRKTDPFELFYKIPVNYVLTRGPHQFSFASQLIAQNPYFCLYKLN